MSKDVLERIVWPGPGFGSPSAGPPVHAGLALAIISVVLPFFSTLAVGLRSYWRFWAKKGIWGWDDILAILSLVPYIAACVFCFLATQYGLGSHDISRINPEMIYKTLTTFAPLYFLTLGLIKISVALSVLRFSFQRRYRWPILGISTITIIVCVFAEIWAIAFCGAFFRSRPTATCVYFQLQIDMFVTVTTLVTDAGCVFIPMFLVRNLRMSRRSKFGLMAALGVGTLPLVAAIIRVPLIYLLNHPTSEKGFYYLVFRPLLSVVEGGLALISSSLPFIGGMFKWFSQPAPMSMGNLNLVAPDVSATPARTYLNRGPRWIKYSWRTKSTSTTRSILEHEESNSGRSNLVFQTSAIDNGRGDGWAV